MCNLLHTMPQISINFVWLNHHQIFTKPQLNILNEYAICVIKNALDMRGKFHNVCCCWVEYSLNYD